MSAPERKRYSVDESLRLSAIASEVGRLLAEAQELQGGGLLQEPQHTGEVVFRMMAPGAEEKCAKAATWFVQAVVNGAAKDVADEWEDHTHGALIRNCLEHMARQICKSAELMPIVYMLALQKPDRYCDCGTELGAGLQIQRGKCDACWTREAVR